MISEPQYLQVEERKLKFSLPITRPSEITNLFPTKIDYQKFSTLWSDETLQITKEDKDLDSIRRQIIDFGKETFLVNMIEGTEKLISLVVESNKKGQRIDTIFFLDKSGRNGSALFQEMWRQLNSEQIATEMPQIRYIDIGRHDNEKFNTENTTSIVEKSLKNSNILGKNILVVDEMMDNPEDGSMAKAISTIDKILSPNRISGHIQFNAPPVWKDHETSKPEVLGVANPINSPEYQQIKYELSKVSYSELVSAISDGETGIAKLAKEHNLDMLPNYLALIKQYHKTAGGFFTTPLRKEQERKEARTYWKYLRLLVKKYMEAANE